MSDTGTPPRMVTTQTADGVELSTEQAKESILNLSPEELAIRLRESMEYDIGHNVLVFIYGVTPDAVKRMDPEVVRVWGRGGFPKQTHCYECGQKLPE